MMEWHRMNLGLGCLCHGRFMRCRLTLGLFLYCRFVEIGNIFFKLLLGHFKCRPVVSLMKA